MGSRLPGGEHAVLGAFGAGTSGRLVIVTAHGSRNPRAAATARAITRAVAAAMPGDEVRCAFLEFEPPGLGTMLGRACVSGRRAIVVPLLITPAYHARVDIPAIVEMARARGAHVEIAPALGEAGGSEPLAGAVVRRLLDRVRASAGLDGVVIAAAGSRDASALGIVDGMASAVSARLGVPCQPGYASGVGRPVRDAVLALRAAGASRIGLGMCFVAPGVLPARAAAQAREAGVGWIAEPLGTAPELISLIAQRARVRAVLA